MPLSTLLLTAAVGAGPAGLDAAAPSSLAATAALAFEYVPAAPEYRLGAAWPQQEMDDATGAQTDELPPLRPGDLIPAGPKFGIDGSRRWYLQGAYAVAPSNNAQFFLGGFGFAQFIAEGLSLNLELNFMAFDQSGQDAGGPNFNVLFQWHFVRRPSWTMYIDGGAGMLWTWDEVPENGSQFNFTPQAGLGFTFALDQDTRLMVGVRWHHISNANLYEDNPGRDSVMVYAALNFPF